MKMRYNAARAVLELMPVAPGCPQATVWPLGSASQFELLEKRFRKVGGTNPE